MKFALVAFLFFVLPVTEWKADPEKAKVDFSVKGLFGTVHGHFTGLKSAIRFDEQNLAGSSITASVDAKTVSTGIGMRNHDLRVEEKWFNTDKFPVISFRSRAFHREGNAFSTDGELTIKGISKPVTIRFTFQPSGNMGLFKGEFSIRRLDFALGKPGGSVGETVTIDLEVPVTKK